MEWDEDHEKKRLGMVSRNQCMGKGRHSAEIDANLKYIHDTQTAYCQACWMTMDECPGHEENIPRLYGAFYADLLKAHTLAVERDDDRTASEIDGVFALYHWRDPRKLLTEGGLKDIVREVMGEQEFEYPEDGKRSEPAWIESQVASEQGYVHTKVEGDQIKEQEPWEQTAVNWHAAATDPSRMSETEWYAASKKREEDLLGEGVLTDPELIAANARLNGEGIKHDAGKDRWDLLPPSIMRVVDVYTIGAKKYDDHNWAKGMAWSRIFRAMMSHAWKWFWGQRWDEEDGQHHLASVAWACLTLMHYEDEGVGTDDRAFVPLMELGGPMPRAEASEVAKDMMGPPTFGETSRQGECTIDFATEEWPIACPVHDQH